MKLRHELTYSANAADVLTMLTTPAFWEKVAEATGALSSTATVSTDDDAITVVVDQEQEVVGVPSFAKKLVGDSTRAVTTQVWRGQAASYVVDTPGTPTSISGTATLTDHGTYTVLLYDLDVRASVPLIGGKLEKLVVELTGEGYRKEQAVGTAWLAGER